MSSSNFFRTLVARGKQGAPHLLDTDDASREVQVRDPAGQILHMKRSQVASNRILNNIDLVYTASTSTSNALSSGSSVLAGDQNSQLVVPARRRQSRP